MPAGGPSCCPTTGRHLIDCDGPQETWQRMAQRSLGRVRVKGLSSEFLPSPAGTTCLGARATSWSGFQSKSPWWLSFAPADVSQRMSLLSLPTYLILSCLKLSCS